MATSHQQLELEIQHFNNFRKDIPGIDRCCQETIDYLLNMGMIQVSTAFEHVLAKKRSTEVVSADKQDLADGCDAKLSSARTSSYGNAYSAPVMSISNKTGTLLVQVYERKQDKFYYFEIPSWAHQNVPKTSNIEIPFELDGTPRRRSRRPVRFNWWDFEVKTFKKKVTESVFDQLFCFA